MSEQNNGLTVESFVKDFRSKHPNYKPGLGGKQLIRSLDRDQGYKGRLIAGISDWNTEAVGDENSGWSSLDIYKAATVVATPIDQLWRPVNWALNLIPGISDRPDSAAGPGTAGVDGLFSAIEAIPGYLQHFKANTREYAQPIIDAASVGNRGLGFAMQLGKAILDIADEDKGVVEAQLRSGAITKEQRDMAISNIDKMSTLSAPVKGVQKGFKDTLAWALDHEDSDAMVKYWNHKSYEWSKWSAGQHQERLDNDPHLRALDAWKRSETPSGKNFIHPQMMVRGFEVIAPSIISAMLPGGVLKVAGGAAQSLGKGTAVAGLIRGSNTMVKVGEVSYGLGNTAVALSNTVSMNMMVAMEGGSEFNEAMYYLVEDPEGPRIPYQEAVPIAGSAATFYGLSSGMLERFQLNNLTKYLNIEKAAKKGWLRSATAKLYEKSLTAGGYKKWAMKGGALLIDDFVEAGVEATQMVLQDAVNEGVRQGYGIGPEETRQAISESMWRTMGSPIEAYSKDEVQQVFWETFSGMLPGSSFTAFTGEKLKNYPEMRDMLTEDGNKINVRSEGKDVILNINGEDTVIGTLEDEETAAAQASRAQGIVTGAAGNMSTPFGFPVTGIKEPEQLALALAHQLWSKDHGEGASPFFTQPAAHLWSQQKGIDPSKLNDTEKIMYAHRQGANAVDQIMDLIKVTGNAEIIDKLEGIPDSLKAEIKAKIVDRWTANNMKNVKGESKVKSEQGHDAVVEALDPDDVIASMADPSAMADPDDVNNQSSRQENIFDEFDKAVNSVPTLESALQAAIDERRAINKDTTETESSDPDDIYKDADSQSVQAAIDEKQSGTRVKQWAATVDLNNISAEGMVETLAQIYSSGGTTAVEKAITGRKKKKNTPARKKLNLTSLNKAQNDLGLDFSNDDVKANPVKVAKAIAARIHARYGGVVVDTSNVSPSGAPATTPTQTQTKPVNQTAIPSTPAGFVKKHRKILSQLIKNGNDNIINASLNSLLANEQGVNYSIADIRKEMGLGSTNEQQIGSDPITPEESVSIPSPDAAPDVAPPVKGMTMEQFKAMREQSQREAEAEFENDDNIPDVATTDSAINKLDDEIGECLL